jgi:hypothetical protein
MTIVTELDIRIVPFMRHFCSNSVLRNRQICQEFPCGTQRSKYSSRGISKSMTVNHEYRPNSISVRNQLSRTPIVNVDLQEVPVNRFVGLN